MRVLILGGSGMLGHKLWQIFASRFDTWGTFRGLPLAYESVQLFDPSRSIGMVSVQNFSSVENALRMVSPNVVINCIGVVKQDPAAKDPITSIEVNALFPHRVAKICAATGTRLIHLSTDCVFSGRRGNYTEKDTPDAEDLYGRTKLLGEVFSENCLTIRTSMIGRELRGQQGLLEWFLSQEGKRVRGYKRAVFSGLTTQALAEVIATVMVDHPGLHGLWNVTSIPISKFDLLTLLRQTYRLAVEIEADQNFICDRSLDGSALIKATGIQPLSWPEMVKDMHDDPTPYGKIRERDDLKG